MPRHESVTDEFIADLQAGFLAEAERVKAAPTWDETQKRMVAGTYPYTVALNRVKEGWTQDQIKQELALRAVLGQHGSFIPGQ